MKKFRTLSAATIGLILVSYLWWDGYARDANVQVTDAVRRNTAVMTKKCFSKSLSSVIQLIDDSLNPGYPNCTLLPEWPVEAGDKCDYYDKVSKTKRIVINDVFKTSQTIDTNDIAVVTQTSLDRLDRVRTLLETWDGPVSVAVHVRYLEVPALCGKLVPFIKSTDNRKRLNLHLVVDPAFMRPYPVNHLRNVALTKAGTDYVFLIDVDFVPSKGLHATLQEWKPQQNQAHVVPAFEVLDKKHSQIIIRNKTQLLATWNKGITGPFYFKEYKVAHYATNFRRWRQSKTKYTISHQEAFEPYVLVNRHNLPLYYEAFMNREYDKRSHIHMLHIKGYHFLVLPDVFIVHYPHEGERASSEFVSCSEDIWAKFRNTTLYMNRNRIAEERKNQNTRRLQRLRMPKAGHTEQQL